MAIKSVKNKTRSGSLLVGNAFFQPTSFESIATLTPSSGTSVTFSSIPQTYKHLQIRAIVRDTYTGAGQLSLRARFNTINTPTSTSYADHYLMGDGTSASAVGASAAANFIIQSSSGSDADLANTFAASIIDIHDYSSTTKNKTVRYIAGYNFNTTSTDASVSIGSGLWVATEAITSITFLANAVAYKAGSTFSLYGIKG